MNSRNDASESVKKYRISARMIPTAAPHIVPSHSRLRAIFRASWMGTIHTIRNLLLRVHRQISNFNNVIDNILNHFLIKYL